MKTSIRLASFAASMLFCGVGIFVANSGSERISNCAPESGDRVFALDGYQFAASRTPKLTFQQLEAIIRQDPTAKQQRGKIEFGSVRVEQGTALAEVMFVSDDGRVLPLLYKLLPQRNSWRIVNVQRMWYVPRSHLLRGVRA
jgi:hypothetical protein